VFRNRDRSGASFAPMGRGKFKHRCRVRERCGYPDDKNCGESHLLRAGLFWTELRPKKHAGRSGADEGRSCGEVAQNLLLIMPRLGVFRGGCNCYATHGEVVENETMTCVPQLLN
jgi:hypothetical protein